MDKMGYRNPLKLEVISRCGGDEKTEWPRRTGKSRTLKIFLIFKKKCAIGRKQTAQWEINTNVV